MVVAVLVHVVSSVATLQHKNQQNGEGLGVRCVHAGVFFVSGACAACLYCGGIHGLF